MILSQERIKTNWQMNMVSQILRDDFIVLLKELPDEFYQQSEEDKTQSWAAILSEVNKGELDPVNLANIITHQGAVTHD